MSEPLHVAQLIQDPPFERPASYSTAIDDEKMELRVKVRFVPDRALSLTDLMGVRSETQAAVDYYFNDRFEIVESNGLKRVLSVRPEFVSENADVDVRISPGKGRSNVNHWYADAEPVVRAHEIGHVLGLKDEYMDTIAPSRTTKDSPGVFHDHSIMGNFYDEGIEQAGFKQRHADEIATRISEAIRMQFHAVPISERLRRGGVGRQEREEDTVSACRRVGVSA
jgi:hypothetical protein